MLSRLPVPSADSRYPARPVRGRRFGDRQHPMHGRAEASASELFTTMGSRPDGLRQINEPLRLLRADPVDSP